MTNILDEKNFETWKQLEDINEDIRADLRIATGEVGSTIIGTHGDWDIELTEVAGRLSCAELTCFKRESYSFELNLEETELIAGNVSTSTHIQGAMLGLARVVTENATAWTSRD